MMPAEGGPGHPPAAAGYRGKPGSDGEEIDRASEPGSAGQSSVGGDKGAVELLGQRDIGGVIRGDVAPKLVGAPHQRQRWEAREREIFEVIDRRGESSRREVARKPTSSKDRHRLDVHEVWGEEVTTAHQTVSGEVAVDSVVSKSVRDGRRVNHDQCWARSSATSAAAVWNPTLPPRRLEIRVNSSSTDGRSARRASSAPKYCWSDCPRSSALRWRAACTSSGMSRTKTLGMLTVCKQAGNRPTSPGSFGQPSITHSSLSDYATRSPIRRNSPSGRCSAVLRSSSGAT